MVFRTVEKVCQFLESVGVDTDTIQRFQVNQVDSDVVNMSKEDDLIHLGLKAMGHRLKLRQFSNADFPDGGEPSTSCSEENEGSPRRVQERRQQLLSLLRRNRVQGRVPSANNRQALSTGGRPKKTTRAISLGMRILIGTERDNEGCRQTRNIKAPLGDKNWITLEFPLMSNYETMLNDIQNTLFKNGINTVVGNQSEFTFELVNGRNENLKDALSRPFTLMGYIEEKHIPGAIRFYLLCCPNTLLVEKSDSDSDAELIDCEDYDPATPSGQVLVRRRRIEQPKITRRSGYFQPSLQTPTSGNSSSCSPARSAEAATSVVALRTLDPQPSTSRCTLNSHSSIGFEALSHQPLTSSGILNPQPSTGSVTFDTHRGYAELMLYSDSEDDLEAAIEATLEDNAAIEASLEDNAVRHPTPTVDGEIIKSIMSRRDVTKQPVLLNVVRGNVLKGARTAFQRPRFDASRPLSIKFMDDNGNSEGAVDAGGPTREFFTLALRELQESCMFSGPSGGKIIVHNPIATDKGMYKVAGTVIALSLAHGGNGPRFLSPLMYRWVTRGYNHVRTTVCLSEVLPGTEVFGRLHRLRDSTTLAEAHLALENMSMFLELSGCTFPLRELSDKYKIIAACVQYSMIDSAVSSMECFLDGLSSLGVLDAVRQNPDTFQPIFCHMETDLCMETVGDLFSPDLSPEGHNCRTRQLTTLAHWNDYLVDIKEGEAQLQFADILMFATGADRVPPCGFEPHPQLQFLSFSPDVKLPTANTCSNILRLPVVFEDYKEFKESFEFAISNAVGFGQA